MCSDRTCFTFRALVLVVCTCQAPQRQAVVPRTSTVAPSPSAMRGGALAAVSDSALCATSGRPIVQSTRGWHVDSGTMRAVVAGSTGDAAALDFLFLGPSSETVPLASGELRRQIGLKLRAQDTCNVLYVMWELEPRAHFVVSMKRNKGLSTHRACGDGGYLALEPRVPNKRAELARVAIGERHTLEARIEGVTLRAFADGQLVWEGELPAEASELDGPAGIRSDNGAFDLELNAAKNGPPAGPWAPCGS